MRTKEQIIENIITGLYWAVFVDARDINPDLPNISKFDLEDGKDGIVLIHDYLFVNEDKQQKVYKVKPLSEYGTTLEFLGLVSEIVTACYNAKIRKNGINRYNELNEVANKIIRKYGKYNSVRIFT
jgi:hypothetical protein